MRFCTFLISVFLLRGAYFKQLHFKDKCRVGRDGPVARGAVAKLRRDNKQALAAGLHPLEPAVPTLDNKATTQHKRRKWLAPYGRVKDCSVLELACVVHHNRVAGPGLGAGAYHLVFPNRAPRLAPKRRPRY